MRSQSSHISNSSYQSVNLLGGNFQQIQENVWNQKIGLLTELNQCIDHRYRVEKQLKYAVEIEKKKQTQQVNPARKQYYEAVIYRNAKLRAQEQQLKRQIMEKTTQKVHYRYIGHDFNQYCRPKSVHDSSRYHESVHSYSQIQNKLNVPKSQKYQNPSSQPTNDELLIDSILNQQKENDQLGQAIRQVVNKQIYKSKQQQILDIQQRLEFLKKILEQREDKKTENHKNGEKYARNRKMQENISVIDNEQNGEDKVSDARNVTNKQMLEYISEEEQQKIRFYQELLQLKEQIDLIRLENQEMKIDLSSRSCCQGGQKNDNWGKEADQSLMYVTK